MTLPHEIYAAAKVVISYIRNGDGVNPVILPSKACRMAKVSMGALQRLLRSDPELKAEYEEALHFAYYSLAEMLADPDQWPTRDPKEAGVWSKNVQWLLARLKAEVFGDRITVENTHSADKTIVEALRAAIERIPLPANGGHAIAPLIDITPQEAPDDVKALMG